MNRLSLLFASEKSNGNPIVLESALGTAEECAAGVVSGADFPVNQAAVSMAQSGCAMDTAACNSRGVACATLLLHFQQQKCGFAIADATLFGFL
jgi:hypothetical protein